MMYISNLVSTTLADFDDKCNLQVSLEPSLAAEGLFVNQSGVFGAILGLAPILFHSFYIDLHNSPRALCGGYAIQFGLTGPR